jgi:hypothetical protein
MKSFTFLSLLLVFMAFASAKETKLYTDDGFFIGGFDPVSYLTEGKSQKGSEINSIIFKGTKILFKDAENKKLFQANPEKYLPAYNGYCAYAMAESGDLVGIDPQSFKVINGKVYLFYNGIWANTLKKWNKEKDIPQVGKADSNWSKHIKNI